jgi:hypothetical protein
MATIDDFQNGQFAGGLNLDDDPLILQPGDYTYMLNGTGSNKYGDEFSVGNYSANKICTYLKEGYHLLHAKLISRNRLVIYSCNPYTNDSEIGILDECEYTVAMNDPCLGFQTNKMIQSAYRQSYNCSDFIYWTDDNQPMRFANLTEPPLDENGKLDCDRLNLFRLYKKACLSLNEVIDIGRLETGVYFGAIQYADENGNPLTPPSNLLGPIDIYEDSLYMSNEKITGDQAGKPTSKGIKFGISNVDTFYQFFNILILKVINGVKTAYKLGPIPITQPYVVYTGTNASLEPIDIQDILGRRPVYTRAKTVDAVDDVLAWGNLKGRNHLNFQKYANKIQVQWQVKRVRADLAQLNYKNPNSTVYKRGYMGDEVYPLAIVLTYTDGTDSLGYPLIGRELNKKSNGDPITASVDQYGNPISGWDTSIVAAGIEDNIEETTLPRWKVYNTATIEGTEETDYSTDESCAEYGEMAYWESDTFTYPDKPEIWGDLAGQKIRHFKFPDSSIIHIHDGEALQRNVKEQPMLRIKGLRFPNIHQIMDELPEEIKKQIQGWRIVRGDRTYNKSVLAKGLMYNTYLIPFTRQNEDDERFYSAWPYNDTRGFFVKDTMGMYGYTGKEQEWSKNKITYNEGTGGVFALVKNDVFTFHSPDTSFKKNSIRANELKIESLEYGKSKGQFRYVDWFPDVRVHENNKDTDPMFVQYESQGWYNNYLGPTYRNTRFKLKDAVYAPSGEQVSTGNIGKPIHNRIREACVVIGTERDIPRSPIEDDSCVWLGGPQPVNSPPGVLKWIDKIVFGGAFNITLFYLTGISSISEEIWKLFNQQYEPYGEYCGVEEDIYRNVSSYYASLKQSNPDQYGSIYDIDWIDIGYCSNNFPTSCVFGGDTFLSFFTLKRKHAFFLCADQYKGADNGSEMQDFPGCQNIPGTKFGYFNRNRTIGWEVLGAEGACSVSGDKGIIPLYYYGVPCFWVESEINTELRHESEDDSGLFFNCLKEGALSMHQWLLRSIYEDNQYLYNFDYSMNNDLVPIDKYTPAYDPNEPCVTDYFSRVIWSDKSSVSDTTDNWQIYKVLNKYDFPNNKGELIDIRYISKNRTLFRFENTLYVHGAYSTLETDDKAIRLGSGRLFEQPPTELSTTDVGYAGTRSQWAFNNTQFGSFMVDDKRGKVFMFNQNGLSEISSKKMRTWFANNLMLNLPKSLPQIADSIDAPTSKFGIGFISTFDYQNNLWILTKKDYELIDKSLAEEITVKDNKFYYNGIELSLQDSKYFIDKSWTISFDPINQRWKSWYSFLPDYYLSDETEFYAAKDNGIWKHNSELYHVYFGKSYPFIVESVTKGNMNTFVLNNMSFHSRCYKYNDRKDDELIDITFDKALFYNTSESTGILDLYVQDENKLSTLFSIPSSLSDLRKVPIRRRDNDWNISDIYNIVNNEDEPLFTDDWASIKSVYPIDKVVNPAAMDYNRSWKEVNLLRGKWIKSRLYFTNHNSFKLLLTIVNTGIRKSYS